MKITLRLLLHLLVIDLVMISVWIALRIYTGTITSLTETTPLFIAAGVLTALATWVSGYRRESSSEYLDSATDLLSKAYEILSTPDENGRPLNRRTNWLTAARLIRTAERISELITEESHKKIWKEQWQYWRGRTYDLIIPNIEGFPSEYYAEKPEHMFAYIPSRDRTPLALSSLAVIHRFIRWPNDIEDPLKKEPPFSSEEIEQMVLFGPRGLGQLLEKVEELRSTKKSKDSPERKPRKAALD